MTEIWDICDQFTCKICFKQYSATVLPVIICPNAHLICKQCVKDMKENNKMPNILCPFCRAVIKPQFVLQFQKFLQLKGATIRILQKQKKQEEILKTIKQQSGFSNHLSLNIQKLYNELTLLDKKWEYVSSLHRNFTVENAILWKKTFESQIQVRKIREQLSNLGEVNRKLAIQAEQSKFLTKKNYLLTKQVKQLKEKIAAISPKVQEQQAQKCDSPNLKRVHSLRKRTKSYNLHVMAQSSISHQIKRSQYDSFLVTMYKNKSQIIQKQENEDDTRPKYEAVRQSSKSQFPPRMPKKKLQKL